MNGGREVRGRRVDGEEFPIFLSVSEVQYQDKRKFVGLIRDLTDQRRAEQETNEYRERLAHVDRLNIIGEMASGIAHEINQPLAAIAMYSNWSLNFAKQELPQQEKLKDVLTKMNNQSHRAAAIIDHVREFSRKGMGSYETVDCNRLIKNICVFADVEASMRGAVIMQDLSQEPCMAAVDSVQIEQVTMNLLRNGMDAMEGFGHKRGTEIIVRSRIEQHSIRISVVDCGIGLSGDAVETLFQPFSSTKKSGMGLGLSICKSIVDAHGGRIGFHSLLAGGTEFYFLLPRVY